MSTKCSEDIEGRRHGVCTVEDGRHRLLVSLDARRDDPRSVTDSLANAGEALHDRHLVRLEPCGAIDGG